MEKVIENNIRLLFPKYKPAPYSRFTKFFQEIDNLNNSFCGHKVTSNKNYDINIAEINKGDEKRKSIIIKCIPSLLGPKNFYNLLLNFSQKINFFYIPGYVSNQKQYMYAFVNVSNNKDIINIVNSLTAIKKNYGSYCGFDFRYIEIYFSKTQGYRALKKKYRSEHFNDFMIS